MLLAGFARADITPRTCSVPLGGFHGSQHRFSGPVYDPLFAHAVALRDGDETCLFVSMDNGEIYEENVVTFRAAISAATGLSDDRIFISESHTHAGPDLISKLPAALQYIHDELCPKLADIAKRAITDLKPAKLSYGTVEVGRPGLRLTFDRHYYCVPIEKKDSYTEADLLPSVGVVHKAMADGEKYIPVRHWEEADHRMHVLRFTREDADDIIVVNFASHCTFTGNGKRPEVSSDYVGPLIDRVETVFPGTKCAFWQGCAGNLVPATEIEEEGIWGVTYPPRNVQGVPGKLPKVIGARPWHKSHHAYADILAGYVFKCLTNLMKDSETDTLSFRQRIYKGKVDHSKDAFVETATQARSLFEAEGHTPAAYAYCESFGLGDIYACESILRRSEQPEFGDIELNAIRIGDCAVTTAPFENYSSTGEHVKDASPFAMTIFSSYCCGMQGYLPNKNVHPQHYEATATHYVLGTAEEIEAQLGEMLQEMYP